MGMLVLLVWHGRSLENGSDIGGRSATSWVIDFGATVESLGVTGFGANVGDMDMTGFSGTVMGRSDFGDSDETTTSPSHRALSERERSCFN